MSRRNAKQLRIDEALYTKAERLQRRYSFAFNVTKSWNDFGNLLLEKGIEALTSEIDEIVDDDKRKTQK